MTRRRPSPFPISGGKVATSALTLKGVRGTMSARAKECPSSKRQTILEGASQGRCLHANCGGEVVYMKWSFWDEDLEQLAHLVVESRGDDALLAASRGALDNALNEARCHVPNSVEAVIMPSSVFGQALKAELGRLLKPQ